MSKKLVGKGIKAAVQKLKQKGIGMSRTTRPTTKLHNKEINSEITHLSDP
jgi:hypothetical protein